MCRLSAFFGAPICAADLVTRPSRSIITQSFDARERMTGDASTPGYLNGDGFGLGWYSSNRNDVVPCVYRQARPAWNDPNLGSIAEKVYTPVLFAHVRAASPGLDVSEGTCHPFQYGRYLWMHNGGVGNFADIRRSVLRGLGEEAFSFAVSHGSSDTALCFAVFLDMIDDKMAQSSPEKLREYLEKTIHVIDAALREVNAQETSLLNFVVSDGESLVASRYVINLTDPEASAASLYYASGNSYQSDGSAPGNYAMKHTDRRPSLTIISSEPLTERRAEWVSVPHNSTIVITKSMHILVAPITKQSDASLSRVLANLKEAQSTQRTKSVAKLVPTEKMGSDNPANSGTSSAAGSTVLSTVTIPGRSVLCCVVMGSLLCSGTDDGTIHVWDLEDNVFFQELRTGRRPVLAMYADQKNKLLIVATSASTVIVYHASEEKQLEPSYTICCEGHGDVLSLARVGSKVYAGFSDAKIRCVVEDVSKWQAPLQETEDDANNTGCSDHEDAICGVTRVHAGHCFPREGDSAYHYGCIFTMTTCLNGRFLCTGSGDGLLRVWDTQSEQCIQTCDNHAGAILTIASYEIDQGSMLFTGSRDCSVKVWVWDGDSGFMCKRTLRKHKEEIVFLDMFGDKLVSGSADGVVCVWCAETLALRCQYRDNSLKAGAVSIDYNLLFTSSDEGAVQIRDMLTTEKSFVRRNSLKRYASNSSRATESAKDIGNSVESMKVPTSSASNLSVGAHGSDAEECCSSNSGDSNDIPISELDDESDGSDIFVPGVNNETVLGPPMSMLANGADGRCRSVPDATLVNGKPKSTGTDSVRERPEKSRNVNGSESSRSHSFSVNERKMMQNVLERFVSFASVSGSEDFSDHCWQGARYIGNFLEGLGASVKYVNTSDVQTNSVGEKEGSQRGGNVSTNPIVLARFISTNRAAKTLTFYGHYDVMPADASQWKTDPWTLASVDGYFYGRGSTDNKGPMVAMVFAIKRLLEENRDGIGCNLVLVLQGEGERSNTGFKDCIEKHLHWFEKTSLILTSNSYWLGEDKPCITYGFRGVVELCVSVVGGTRNLHSGVDGGAIFEPLNDLIAILGTLVDAGGSVCVPGFYEDVRPLTPSEKKRFNDVDFTVEEYKNGVGMERFTTDNSAELLESRWRKPSVSIACIKSSNASGFYSVIPREAHAKISIRFVPDQNPLKIKKAVETHLWYEMKRRLSPNSLKVECVNTGDWWLGNPSCPQFQIAERAIKSVWGVSPDYVCEGGSMPLFSYLVKTLDAPLVQIPLGQSSDSAHLPNERIRAMNLFKGKEVLQSIIQEFAESNL